MPAALKSMIVGLVSGIEPTDDLGREHRRNASSWLAETTDLGPSAYGRAVVAHGPTVHAARAVCRFGVRVPLASGRLTVCQKSQ